MKAVLLVLCVLALAGPVAAQPPNIVLIIGDDHGWPYSGFMGDPYAVTPNLDALAQQGTVFRNLHMMSATCEPSLQGLLAGIDPLQWSAATQAVRARRGAIPYREEVEHFRTLPRELQRRGYAAWEGGKMWEGSFTQAGFTHGLATHIPYDPPGCAIFCSVGEDFGRTGIAPFRDFLDQTAGKPFFAWVAPMLPHTPFDAPAQYRAPYEGLGLAWYQIDYYANVTWLDAVVGDVVAELDARGLRDNTLIVYLSDNGWEIGSSAGFGKGKGTMYELGFRTPLVFNWAGHVPAGVRRDDLVAEEDVFTTLLDYAGAAPLADRAGSSLKPALESGTPFGRDKVVAYYATNTQGGHVVRTPQWRYIAFEGTNPHEELYAIATDPYETVDVAAQQPALLAAFRDDVTAFQTRIASAPSPLAVSGRVVDAGGEPVSSLPVQLTTASGTQDIVTAAGGWFDFAPVAHGTATLSASGAAADWFGIGPTVPVDVPVGALAPYVPLTVPGYQNPIGAGAQGKDPTVLVDGGTYYLFSSHTGDPALAGNIPLQRSSNLLAWEYLGDALPNLPVWVDPDDAEVRGPATLTRPSVGRYLLYFSARHRDDGSPQAGRRCIGAVAAAAPTMLLDGSASLISDAAPLFCDSDGGDVFDPFIFTAAAPSGDPYAWMIWVRHRDGEPDVIFNQLLQADGITPAVPPFPMLTAETFVDFWENGRLANPSVLHDPASGTDLLFYSANDPVYSVDQPTATVIVGAPDQPAPQRYGANWATCPSAYGVFLPCTRNERGPWLRSQNGAFRPGDAEVFRDTSGALWMVYDASARVVGFGAAVYQAPTLRLDRVCLDGGVPRTTAPTTDLQPSERSAACSDDVHLLGEPWPEADQLFRRDPRWRGGDGAWSIDLGNARSLWIFGDSFIDPEGQTRESSFFIRNSIAVQQGADPSTADMTFYWQTTAQGQPTAYFPNSGNIWYWGGAGAVIDNKVVLFQQGNQLDAQNNVVRAPTRAVLIGNYTGDPSTWTQQWYDVPPDPGGYIWGPHYAFTYGSHLYVYATRPPAATGGSANTAALLRFTKSNAKVGNFTKPQWWTGSQYVIDGQPATLWDPSTQYSVHALPSGEHLAIMGGIAYGPGLFATAADRSGPFSPFQTFYVPPEGSWGGDGGGVLNYIWHAHPQLSGAPVVATYSTHGLNVLEDESPYYPKFVRFTPP